MIIGGHVGLSVSRENGAIVKRAHTRDGEGYYQIAVKGLANEARMLRAMSKSGWTPELIEEGPGYIVQTDLGDGEPVQLEQSFRRECVRMLYDLRRRNIRHGDLTDRNIIVRDNRPWLVDWQESHFIGETAPQKQPWSDSELLFRSLSTWHDAAGQVDPSRITRRWRAVLIALGANRDLTLPLKGQTFLDLGCFQGDMVAMAAAEGMDAEGVDFGGFRSGEDSIDIARELWAGMDCRFVKADIMSLPLVDFEARDVAVMFSTWPYIVMNHGRERAEQLLENVVKRCCVFFFEVQLYGDGPGPEFLRSNDDVLRMLERWGKAEAILTLPVGGREANRTVWIVTK